MYNRDLLHTHLQTVTTPLLESIKSAPIGRVDHMALDNFLQLAPKYFMSSKLNQLTGLDAFPVIEATMGCNHFIDNLIMQHGINGVQIFEHDYKYYYRLKPDLELAQPGHIKPNQPIIIAMPSPGWMDIHPMHQEILDEAYSKNCPVHIDAAWITAAKGIKFNFNHPSIHSVAMSLSKGMDLWWNRVGIRWSRKLDDTDSITIYNKKGMLSERVLQTGLLYLEHIPPDHVWLYYENKYNDICRALKLRPTKMVHVAQTIDRKQMLGLKKVLEQNEDWNL